MSEWRLIARIFLFVCSSAAVFTLSAEGRALVSNQICLAPPTDLTLLLNYCSNCCDSCCSRNCQNRSLPQQCPASTPLNTCSVSGSNNFVTPLILTQAQCDLDVRCTNTRAPLSYDPSTLAYCVCTTPDSRFDPTTVRCIPNTVQPAVLGCIPATLAEYNTYSDTRNNCSLPNAEGCIDQHPIDFRVESQSMGGESYGGFYTPRGEKCPTVTAASETCPFFVRTYVIPHCDTCGPLNPANPNKCKKVTEFEFGYSIEQQFQLPGILPVPKIETLKDSDPLPPASSGMVISRPRTRKIAIPDLLK